MLEKQINGVKERNTPFRPTEQNIALHTITFISPLVTIKNVIDSNVFFPFTYNMQSQARQLRYTLKLTLRHIFFSKAGIVPLLYSNLFTALSDHLSILKILGKFQHIKIFRVDLQRVFDVVLFLKVSIYTAQGDFEAR